MMCKEALSINHVNGRLSSSAAPDGQAAADVLAVPHAVEAVAPDAERVLDAMQAVDAAAPRDGTPAADVASPAVGAVALLDGTPAGHVSPLVADEVAAQDEPQAADAVSDALPLPEQADGMLPEHEAPLRQGAPLAQARDAECSEPDVPPEQRVALPPHSPSVRNWVRSSAARAHGCRSRRCGLTDCSSRCLRHSD